MVVGTPSVEELAMALCRHEQVHVSNGKLWCVLPDHIDRACDLHNHLAQLLVAHGLRIDTANLREQALAKLTPEERAALG